MSEAEQTTLHLILSAAMQEFLEKASRLLPCGTLSKLQG